MRYLLILILLLLPQNYSSSQYYFINSDSVSKKPIIEKTYLKFYPEQADEKQTTFFDFSFTLLNIKKVQRDSTYGTESVFNYGVGLDYNYDLNNNEIIDFSLVINTTISNLTLNGIRFSIIFYF
jgi:hypothetical protein